MIALCLVDRRANNLCRPLPLRSVKISILDIMYEKSPQYTFTDCRSCKLQMRRQGGALEPLVDLLRLGADDPAALAAAKALLAAATDSERNQARDSMSSPECGGQATASQRSGTRAKTPRLAPGDAASSPVKHNRQVLMRDYATRRPSSSRMVASRRCLTLWPADLGRRLRRSPCGC